MEGKKTGELIVFVFPIVLTADIGVKNIRSSADSGESFSILIAIKASFVVLFDFFLSAEFET